MSNAALDAVFTHSKTKNGARLLMVAVADRANEAGRCWPGIKDLMHRTGLSKTGVYTATRQAQELKELHVDEYGGPNRTHLYTILIPNRSDSEPFAIRTDTVRILNNNGSASEHKPSLTQRNPHSPNQPRKRPRPASDPDFETFWDHYPRKVAKVAAIRAWNATTKERPPLPDLLAALDCARSCEQWREPRYIPHPATWLNQHRWQDQPTEQQPLQLRL